MAKIQVDMDGVLADFMWEFTGLAAIMGWTEKQISCLDSKFWNDYGGMSAVNVGKTWDLVKASEAFWFQCPSLPPIHEFQRLDRMQVEHDVYFVTARVGRAAKYQTEAWLWKYGISRPTVLVTSRKGAVAAALEADYSIEDNLDNAVNVHDLARGCQSFVLDRKYNQPEMTTPDLPRVATLTRFFQHIDKETHAAH